MWKTPSSSTTAGASNRCPSHGWSWCMRRLGRPVTDRPSAASGWALIQVSAPIALPSFFQYSQARPLESTKGDWSIEPPSDTSQTSGLVEVSV